MARATLSYDRNSTWEDVRRDIAAMMDGPDAITAVTIDGIEPSGMTNLTDLFSECSCLEEVGIADAGRGVTSIGGLFGGCMHLKRADVGGLRTDSVVDMTDVFCNCKWLAEIDLSAWDVRKVRDMQGMFYGCRSLERVDLSGWRPSELRSAECMFEGCESLREIVADQSTLRALRRARMVVPYGCRFVQPEYKLHANNDMTWTELRRRIRQYGPCGLTEVIIARVDTSRVRTAASLFEGCAALTTLDLSGLDTWRMESMARMFEGCRSLGALDLAVLDTSSVTSMWGMFLGCASLVDLDLSGWDVSAVIDMQYMLMGCTSLERVDLSAWTVGTGHPERAVGMFAGCEKLKEIVASGETIKALELAGARVPRGCAIVERPLGRERTER